MPRTVDLFLDSDQPLDRVAEQLAELSNARFVASPDRATLSPTTAISSPISPVTTFSTTTSCP